MFFISKVIIIPNCLQHNKKSIWFSVYKNCFAFGSNRLVNINTHTTYTTFKIFMNAKLGNGFSISRIGSSRLLRFFYVIEYIRHSERV